MYTIKHPFVIVKNYFSFYAYLQDAAVHTAARFTVLKLSGEMVTLMCTKGLKNSMLSICMAVSEQPYHNHQDETSVSFYISTNIHSNPEHI